MAENYYPKLKIYLHVGTKNTHQVESKEDMMFDVLPVSLCLPWYSFQVLGGKAQLVSDALRVLMGVCTEVTVITHFM